ncbi:MAG: hypothetical protein ABSF48_23695 [Thermodesulfobacteriota bacterium]|jgi:hypothetical protein
MKACEVHDRCVVVFNGDDCPLCKAQETVQTICDEMEKSMTVLKELKKAGEVAGLRFN